MKKINRKKIVCIQRIVPHYRVPFFRKLQKQLANEDISFMLIHGNEEKGTVPKGNGDLIENFNNDKFILNTYLNIFKLKLVWQPILISVFKADLVIVEYSNRLLVNYIIIFMRKIGLIKKIAFWGHARNYQGNKNSLRERFKSKYLQMADFFFMYTEEECRNEKRIKKKIGINNSIDILPFKKNIEEISKKIKKNRYGLVYCGGMYDDKEIPFLLKSLEVIKKNVPEMVCEFIGDGPLGQLVDEFCKDKEWATNHGYKNGYEKFELLWRNSCLLMPGLVGLVVLDSFCSLTPLLTTFNGKHSPEISYLKNGHNGLISDFNVESYTNIVTLFLKDENLQKKLQEGCKESSKYYSLENMVNNFCKGINEIFS